MTYLTKIVLRNFKSFGGVTRLNLERGFNVITGPNGSGKSNIIDAVQFVLGELASRRMRASDLTELIYDGGGGQRATAAQVSMTLDNSDRSIPIDKPLVTVGRSIDRRGNSKYFLNGKRTSRRVLLDILGMAGISPGGYNIVLQGAATRLSDLTPQERMSSLKELIGISVYEEKKAEAERRLSEAERKIEVASARVDEVRKRVVELEGQRNDAVRYRLLVEEERELSAIKLSMRLFSLEERIGEVRKRLEGIEAELGAIEETREGLILEREKALSGWEELNRVDWEDEGLEALRSDFLEKSSQKAKIEARIKEIDSKKQGLQALIEEKSVELEKLRLEIKEKNEDFQRLIQIENQMGLDILEKEDRLKTMEEEIRKMKEDLDRSQKNVESLSESMVAKQEVLKGLEIELEKKLYNLNGIKEKILELENKREEIYKTLRSLSEKYEELEKLRESEVQRLHEMLLETEKQVERQRRLRGIIVDAGRLAKEVETTITQFSAKRELWQKVAAAERGLERVKEMGEAGALPGYHGPLEDLIGFRPEYQRAIINSSNGWIKAIVFEDLNSAMGCIELLKRTKVGFARFIPLKDIRDLRPLPEPSGEGIIGPLPRFIRFDEKYLPAINLVWGDVLLVRDGTHALRMAEKGYRAVTISGAVYEAVGGVIGGYHQKPEELSKMIPKEESINALKDTITTLRERILKRMNEIRLSGSSLRKFVEFVEGSRSNINKIEEQMMEIKENINRLEKNLDILEKKKGELDRQINMEEELIKTLRERRDKVILDIDKDKYEIVKIRENIKSYNLDEADKEINELRQKISQLKDEKSKTNLDISILNRMIKEILEPKISELEYQIKSWKDEINAILTEKEEISGEIKLISEKIVEINTKILDSESKIKQKNDLIFKYKEKIDNLEQNLSIVEKNREKLLKIHYELKLDLERLQLELEQGLRDLGKLGFSEKAGVEGVDLEELEGRLEMIRAERSSLGAVNNLAEAQYNEFVGNYKQLSIRINELEEEKASIIRFIEEVEREKLEHFMKAFHEICESFSSIFSKLTGGGEGRLELQRPESPFSGGVDLYIQFPGKPMRLASGASGGERSVATIAYLLAIQSFLKAPFYLLDEIDAHLDSVNVSRLAEVLRERSSEAQFIVISLKDVMLHGADKIYGVFNPGDRSRVIALPMAIEVVS
ncbi:MAG: chromosome segregation SMC family protein [Candidatus Bathyarchaeia archaeon]